MMGTHLEKRGKNKKKSLSPHPLKNLRKKNGTVHEGMLSLPIRCMKFLFPKLFVTIVHPPAHHPLDVHYDSVVDEPQLSSYLVSSW
jgi:hypothetical protein